MAYFEDLSPYKYLSPGPGIDSSEAFNIGWLDRGHAFPIGDVQAGFINGLVKLCRAPVNLTRGVHFCNLCPVMSADEHRSMFAELTVFKSEGADVFVGNGELRVLGRSGLIYAAPTLILHYVAQHRYLPLQDFVDGVMAMA